MTQVEYEDNNWKLINITTNTIFQRHPHFRKLHIIASKSHPNQNCLKEHVILSFVKNKESWWYEKTDMTSELFSHCGDKVKRILENKLSLFLSLSGTLFVTYEL